MHLKVHELQDISEVVADLLTGQTMDKAFKRVGVEPVQGYASSVGKESYVYGTLDAYNGTEDAGRLLSAMMSQITVTSVNVSRLQKAFSGSSLDLVVVADKFELRAASGSIVADALGKPEDFLRVHAPPEVVKRMDHALRTAAVALDYHPLEAVRHAFEKLAIGGSFQKALQELEQTGLLDSEKSLGSGRRSDVEFLKSVYGVLSTHGSHSGADRQDPSRIQCQVYLAVGLHALEMVVRVLRDARDKGITLKDWDFSSFPE